MNIDEAKQKLQGSAAHSLREVLRIGGEIATVAVHLTTTTTTLGKVGAVIGVANAVLGGSSLESRFDGLPTLQLPSCLKGATFSVLWHGGRLIPGAENGKEKIWTMEDGGTKLAWIRDGDKVKPAGPWILSGDEEAAGQLVGRSIWEILGPRLSLEVKRWGDEAEIVVDDFGTLAPSALSESLAAMVRMYHAVGVNRSVLLHGPSGTGKSFVIRDVADRLGGFSLRFSSQWGGVESLQKAVKILRPRTLIIDDICRSSMIGMLDALEGLGKVVPLVAASANYTDKLDPATRRPGRFDREILVTKLDADTFAEMTKGAADQDRLRELPAAYVNEYMLTRTVEGQEAASALLPALEKLAAEISAADAPATAEATVVKAVS